MRLRPFCTLCLVAAMSLLSIPAARAAYTITVDQVGPDVVATGGGSLDLSGLSFFPAGGSVSSFIEADNAEAGVGSSDSIITSLGVTGPASFGPGPGFAASSMSGVLVAVSGGFGAVLVPNNYVSKAPFGASTGTWNNQTLAGMGLMPGTYVYSLPDDSFTVTILPEPASLCLITLAAPLLLRRERRGTNRNGNARRRNRPILIHQPCHTIAPFAQNAPLSHSFIAQNPFAPLRGLG